MLVVSIYNIIKHLTLSMLYLTPPEISMSVTVLHSCRTEERATAFGCNFGHILCDLVETLASHHACRSALGLIRDEPTGVGKSPGRGLDGRKGDLLVKS